MKKLVFILSVAATVWVSAKESVTNEFEEVSAPILWGFGNFGFYSGYQLYDSILNPDPVLQGYVEANLNIPLAVNRITKDWSHSFALVNPYLIPYINAVHEYRVTYANLLQFGVRKLWQIMDVFSVTPFVELVWRDRRYGWCFANYGLDGNYEMQNAGLATLKLELDATYMFTKYFGAFAKVAYGQNLDPHLRESSDISCDLDPTGQAYGRYNEYCWGGIGVRFSS